MTDATRRAAALALAGTLAAALGMASVPGAVQAEEQEKCFGIAKAGGNDCASEASNSCAGQSKVDYDGKAWKLVKTGTCVTTEVEIKNADGTVVKRKGSLEPIKS